MSLYTETFQKNQYNLPQVVQKSKTWFQQQALLLSKQNIQPLKLIRSSPEKNVMKIIPGDLVLFMYDAKTQDKLQYWDMFPLVFPFRKLTDGFIGLNLHYLPYYMRARLLDRLMDFSTNQLMNENTRLRYKWSTISSVARYAAAFPCVHRYLLPHIQTPLKKIDSQDWTTALMLPVERFIGASKQRVWSESMR